MVNKNRMDVEGSLHHIVESKIKSDVPAASAKRVGYTSLKFSMQTFTWTAIYKTCQARSEGLQRSVYQKLSCFRQGSNIMLTSLALYSIFAFQSRQSISSLRLYLISFEILIVNIDYIANKACATKSTNWAVIIHCLIPLAGYFQLASLVNVVYWYQAEFITHVGYKVPFILCLLCCVAALVTFKTLLTVCNMDLTKENNR